MNDIIRDYNFYLEEYVNKQQSPTQIAERFGVYSNLIRRELKKLGFKPRNKSEAQKLALQSGRHKHPTRGTERSESTKIEISNAMAKSWQNVSEEERARRTEVSRKQWEALSDDERTLFRKNAAEAVRKASREGSKLEKYLKTELQNSGLSVIYHSDDIIPNEKLQTDLYLPGIKVVIEIDGPSHFYPIWGEEALQRTIEADNKKNQTLVSYGIVVIRIKHLSKAMSAANNRNLLQNVLDKIEEIKKKFPKKEDMIIEIQEGIFKDAEANQ